MTTVSADSVAAMVNALTQAQDSDPQVRKQGEVFVQGEERKRGYLCLLLRVIEDPHNTDAVRMIAALLLKNTIKAHITSIAPSDLEEVRRKIPELLPHAPLALTGALEDSLHSVQGHQQQSGPPPPHMQGHMPGGGQHPGMGAGGQLSGQKTGPGGPMPLQGGTALQQQQAMLAQQQQQQQQQAKKKPKAQQPAMSYSAAGPGAAKPPGMPPGAPMGAPMPGGGVGPVPTGPGGAPAVGVMGGMPTGPGGMPMPGVQPGPGGVPAKVIPPSPVTAVLVAKAAAASGVPWSNELSDWDGRPICSLKPDVSFPAGIVCMTPNERSICHYCMQKIFQGEVRVGVQPEKANKGVALIQWFHVGCVSRVPGISGAASLVNIDKAPPPVRALLTTLLQPDAGIIRPIILPPLTGTTSTSDAGGSASGGGAPPTAGGAPGGGAAVVRPPLSGPAGGPGGAPGGPLNNNNNAPGGGVPPPSVGVPHPPPPTGAPLPGPAGASAPSAPGTAIRPTGPPQPGPGGAPPPSGPGPQQHPPPQQQPHPPAPSASSSAPAPPAGAPPHPGPH